MMTSHLFQQKLVGARFSLLASSKVVLRYRPFKILK